MGHVVTDSLHGSGITYGDRAVMAKIVADKAKAPSVHGLDIKDGVLWNGDANTDWICNLT